jgi:hypothetical protein
MIKRSHPKHHSIGPNNFPSISIVLPTGVTVLQRHAKAVDPRRILRRPDFDDFDITSKGRLNSHSK